MSLKSPDDMTPEQIAQALKNAHILETWIHAVKAHAFEVLKAGGEIPGYKLGFGAKKRIWKEGVAEKDIVWALKSEGVDPSELFTKPELISPPKVEKLLKELGKWPAKKRGEQRPKTPLDGFIDYSMPEPRVMPVEPHDETTDRNIDAERDFG